MDFTKIKQLIESGERKPEDFTNEEILAAVSLDPNAADISAKESERRKRIVSEGMDRAGSTAGITRAAKALGPARASAIQKSLEEMPAGPSEDYMGALKKIREMFSKEEMQPTKKSFDPEMQSNPYSRGAEDTVGKGHDAQGILINRKDGMPMSVEAAVQSSPLNKGIAERKLVQTLGELSPESSLHTVKQPIDSSDFVDLIKKLQGDTYAGRYSGMENAGSADELQKMIQNNPLKDLGTGKLDKVKDQLKGKKK